VQVSYIEDFPTAPLLFTNVTFQTLLRGGALAFLNVGYFAVRSIVCKDGQRRLIVRVVTRNGKENAVGKVTVTFACRSFYTPECSVLAVILHLLFTLCYRGGPCPEFTHSGEGSVFKTPLFCSGVGSSDAPVETTTVSAMVKLLRDALKIKGYPEFENIKKLLHIGRNQGVKRAAEAMMGTTKALQQIGMPVAQGFYIHNRSICTHFEFWLARAAVVVGDAALTPVVILWPLSQFRRLGNWVNEQTSVLEMSYMPNCPRAALGPAAGFRETDAIQTARELATLHQDLHSSDISY
jgi:hypothetical protein